MKKILFTILFSTLLFWGCEQTSDPVTGPITKLDKPLTNSSGGSINTLTYDIIPLPERSPIYLDSVFTVSKIINGLLGGRITLDRLYISRDGRLVTMLVDIVILPLSFNGQRNITLTIDRDHALVNCEPGMTFHHPLIMLQTFTGLDLSNYNSEDIDFVYLKKNGDIEEVENAGIIVIKPTGTLTVLNAQIDHFSRYGWVRKHGNNY